MKITKNAYVSQKIRHKTVTVAKFRVNKLVPGIFIIREADDPDQLEIIRADFFKQPGLRRPDDKPILAFAAGYDDAVDIITNITREAMYKYATPDLKKYVYSDYYGSVTYNSEYT